MNYGLSQVLLRDRFTIRPTMVLRHQCVAQGLCLPDETNDVRTEHRGAAYFSFSFSILVLVQLLNLIDVVWQQMFQDAAAYPPL